MKISSKGRYAVRVMVEIASSNKKYISLTEIAEKQSISVKYLEKILSLLLKAKLIDSLKGSLGGYKLSKPANEYNIAEILSVTGDLPKLAPCQKNNTPCPQKANCTTISCWENLSKLIYDYLTNISLVDLIKKC